MKMMMVNPLQRATLLQVIDDQWVNRGYLAPPVDYMEDPGRWKKQQGIPIDLIDTLLACDVCEAGRILMSEIKQRTPHASIVNQLEKYTHEECISIESVDSPPPTEFKDRGHRWWSKLKRTVSKMHARMSSASSKKPAELQPPINSLNSNSALSVPVAARNPEPLIRRLRNRLTIAGMVFQRESPQTPVTPRSRARAHNVGMYYSRNIK